MKYSCNFEILAMHTREGILFENFPNPEPCTPWKNTEANGIPGTFQAGHTKTAILQIRL